MSERDTDDDIQHIAVIGMAGRFPGARDPEEFWRNIADGVESVTRLSEQDLLAAGVPERRFRDPGYVRAATVLDGMEQFDAGLFGLTPMEAAILDPQHRMLLEGTQARSTTPATTRRRSAPPPGSTSAWASPPTW